jgi:hypothetical protein
MVSDISRESITHSLSFHRPLVGHWGEHVSAPAGLTVNLGQGVHTPAPAGLNVPSGHSTGTLAATGSSQLPDEHAWPEGHMHASLELPLLPMSEYGKLIGQLTQAAAPEKEQKVPLGQGRQTPWPAALKVPAPQSICGPK